MKNKNPYKLLKTARTSTSIFKIIYKLTPPHFYILLVVFLTLKTSVSAQQTKIDSLKSVLEKTEAPAKRLEVLTGLTKEIHQNSHYKNNLIYITKLQSLAKEFNNDTLIAQSEIYLSESYLFKEKTSKAEEIIINSLQQLDTISYPNTHYHLLNQLARIYHAQDNFEKAIETFNKAITKYTNKPTGSIIFHLYDNLSSSYRQLKKNNLSEEAIIKAISYAEKLNLKSLEVTALNNLAWQLMTLKEYEKADKYFKKNLDLNTKYNLGDEGYIHRALGLNYSRWGKYEKALQHNLLALKILQEGGNKRYAFDVMNSIAVTYNRMKEIEKSIAYGKKTLKAAKELKHLLAIRAAKNTLAVAYKNAKNYPESLNLFQQIAKDTINDKKEYIDFKVVLLDNLSEIYFAQKQYKKSLTCFKRKTFLKDSINKELNKSKIVEFETQYQTEKKEKENLQLKVEKAEQQQQLKKESQQKWLYGTGFLLSVLALTIFGYYYRKNQQQKQLIESLQKELHHRVKNNLSIIDRFVEVLKEEFNEPKFTSKLNELQNRIGSINEVHQQLYHNKNVTQLNMKSYVNQLANNVQQSFPNSTININQQIDKNLALTSTKSFPLGIIINEFLTNSYKYAFENNKGSISIKMKEAEKNYTLFLSDNGKGLSDDFDIKNDANFGLRIVRLLCDQINAKFNLENNKGVQLTIQIPK